jgi:Concanavalin A-like lectin/glucanases superfamily
MTGGLVMPQQSYQLMLADPFTLPDFTDITQFFQSWEGTTMGRQHELQLFQPGAPSITLTNIGGWFNTWDTTSPFYNLLTPGDASAETADGTVNTAPVVSNWLGGTTSNCTVTVATPPVIIDGPTAYALGITGTTATVTMPDNYYAVDGGALYSIMCSFLAGTGSDERTCTVNVLWYTSGGSLISTVGAAVVDNTSTWTKASLLGVQAPSNAAFAALQVEVAGGSAETHWFSRAALFNYLDACVNTAWGPGQRGLVVGRPIKHTATWDSVTYPQWSMYVANWTPAYKSIVNFTTLNLTDALGLLALCDLSSSAYANQVLADGASSFWRLGDGPGQGNAADSGPNNYTLQAPGVQFGQTPPILTDDTTVAAFQTSSSQGYIPAIGAQAPPVGEQSLELLFMIPTGQTTVNQLFESTNGSSIAFNPATNEMELVYNGGSAGATLGAITDTLIANGAWHHLVVSCTAATGGTVRVYLDGVLIGFSTATGGNSSCLFDQSSAFRFGAALNGTDGFSGQMGDIAVYSGTYLTTDQVENHYTLYSAGFAVEYSGQRISAMLDVLGWPADLQDIDTGIQMVQGATSSLTQTAALSYLQSVEQTEGNCAALFSNQEGVLTFYDRWYVITSTQSTVSNGLFSSDPSDSGAYHFERDPNIVPAMDDEDTWNDVPAQRIGGVLQRVKSALSIKQYRQRTLVGFTGELQTDDSDVLAQAQWLLEHYENPITRVRSITLTSVADAGANLPQMLGRGIFDLVTVKWRPMGSSGIYFVQESLIEQISHRVEQGKWVTTWMLSPSETQPYLVLDNTTLGKLDSGNRLGY